MLIAHVLREKGSTVHTVSSAITLEDAARELHAKKVGAVVVIDEEGEVAGVFSERDIIREVARRGPSALAEPVSSAMTRSIITARPHETIDEGLGRMTDRRVRHLPVVEDGRLAGIVSIGDLVKHRIAAAEAVVAAMEAYITTH